MVNDFGVGEMLEMQKELRRSFTAKFEKNMNRW